VQVCTGFLLRLFRGWRKPAGRRILDSS